MPFDSILDGKVIYSWYLQAVALFQNVGVLPVKVGVWTYKCDS